MHHWMAKAALFCSRKEPSKKTWHRSLCRVGAVIAGGVLQTCPKWSLCSSYNTIRATTEPSSTTISLLGPRSSKIAGSDWALCKEFCAFDTNNEATYRGVPKDP